MKKIDISHSVLFISEIRAPDCIGATSTHIMTANLLFGMRECRKSIVFLAICQHYLEAKEIEDYYQQFADKVVIINSFFGFDLGKYQQLFKILSGTILKRNYEKTINGLLFTGIPQLIITHAPSFEAIFYGEVLKKRYPGVLFYEYWSDPVTLSGITPEKISYKRLPFQWTEYLAIKHADRVIYGTKTLMQFQKIIFPKYASKMTYVDVAYIPHINKARETEQYSNRLLYAGNYFSNIRNLLPLAKAVSQKPDLFLDVYGQGDCVFQAPNIVYHGRVSPDELAEIETRYKMTVCVLNHSCIQIPGKVFYAMDTEMKMLVITDGMYENDLVRYLNEYQRFIICRNNTQEILESLNELSDAASDYTYARAKYAPEKIATDLLSGGLSGE